MTDSLSTSNLAHLSWDGRAPDGSEIPFYEPDAELLALFEQIVPVVQLLKTQSRETMTRE